MEVWPVDFSAFYVYDIPYIQQAETYWCGPASLAMILSYWGASVTQEEIAGEIYNPAINMTYISEMKAYPQDLGFETQELIGSIGNLKEWIRRGRPPVVLQKFSPENTYGHFRIVVAYDDEKELFVTYDPVIGSDYEIVYSEFVDLWKPGSTFSTFNWTLVIFPKDSFLTQLMEDYQVLINQQTLSVVQQAIKLEDILLIVSAIALVLGAVGGVPEIVRWTKPKPRLRIAKSRVEKSEGSRIVIDLEVQNEQKWWRKTADATYVTAEWYMMDRNHEQWGGVHNQIVSPYLMAGTKVSRQFSSTHSFKPEGNPHTIAILVKCEEGVQKRKKVTYVATE